MSRKTLIEELRAALWQVRMDRQGCEEWNDCYSDCSEYVNELVAEDLFKLELEQE